MIKTFCDFCEQEVQGSVTCLEIKADGGFFVEPLHGEYFMCRKCAREMRNHLVAATQLMERFGQNRKSEIEEKERRGK